MVERLIPRMSKKLETGIEGVVGDNGGSEVEDVKVVLEIEDVEEVEAVSFEDDKGMKRASTMSRDCEREDETWFFSFFTLFFMSAAADIEKAGWWRSTV